jgi:hypothetical protein
VILVKIDIPYPREKDYTNKTLPLFDEGGQMIGNITNTGTIVLGWITDPYLEFEAGNSGTFYTPLHFPNGDVSGGIITLERQGDNSTKVYKLKVESYADL